MGTQVGMDPKTNPRWSEEEGRILTLEEYTSGVREGMEENNDE